MGFGHQKAHKSHPTAQRKPLGRSLRTWQGAQRPPRLHRQTVPRRHRGSAARGQLPSADCASARAGTHWHGAGRRRTTPGAEPRARSLLLCSGVRPVRTGWPSQQQTTRFADKPHGMLHGNSATQHTVRTDTSDGGRGEAFGTSVRSDVHESQSVLLLNSNQTSWVSGPVPNFWQVVQFRIFPS